MKKIHQIGSTAENPAYDSFITHCENSLEIENEIDEIIIDKETETNVTKGVNRINESINNLYAFSEKLITLDPFNETVNAIELAKAEAVADVAITQALEDIGGALAYGVTRTAFKQSGSKMMDEMMNTRNINFIDLQYQAYEMITRYYVDDIGNGKPFSLSTPETRQVRKSRTYGLNHEFTGADYRTETTTRLRWINKALSAYVQAQRGVRVSVPMRKTVWDKKQKKYVDKVVNNSVYFPVLDVDGMTEEVLYRVKADNVNSDSHDRPVNGAIVKALAELRADMKKVDSRFKGEKILTNKAWYIIRMRLEGESWNALADYYDQDPKQIRESFEGGLKAIARWLDKPYEVKLIKEEGKRPRKEYYIGGNKLPF